MSGVILRMLHQKKALAAADAELRRKQQEIIDEARGEKGDTGPMPDHEWKGTRLRFQKPDGGWGDYADLKGKPGRDGKDGAAGRTVVVAGGGGSPEPTVDPLAYYILAKA